MITTSSVWAISGAQLWQWQCQAKQEAVAADIDPVEVDWFLQAVSSLDRLALRLESYQEQSTIELQRSWDELTHLWQQRLERRVPLQYLVGQVPWRRFMLKVAPGVLIPRPETEGLIDLVANILQLELAGSDLSQGHWADLGTGSGAIALGLADLLQNARIHAVDQSLEALTIAQENARSLGLERRIQFYYGSWWEPLRFLAGQLDGMVSNPPYIPRDMVAQLQPEVANHEPLMALDGGEDGLECIRHLVETAPLYLKPGGIWLVEMMAGQADSVVKLLENQGSYSQIQVFKDLAGVERFILAYRN